jgi:hypothetical protein
MNMIAKKAVLYLSYLLPLQVVNAILGATRPSGGICNPVYQGSTPNIRHRAHRKPRFLVVAGVSPWDWQAAKSLDGKHETSL